MNQTEREETTRAVEQFLNESLERILLSNPVNPQQLSRARLRPLLIKGELRFQVEEQAGKQAFHRNLDAKEAAAYVTDRLDGQFRQAEMTSALGSGLILVSKKGKVTVKVKGRGKPRPRPRGSPPCPITGRSGIFWKKGLRCRFWSILA